jgi:hypothetical protein
MVKSSVISRAGVKTLLHDLQIVNLQSQQVRYFKKLQSNQWDRTFRPQ